MHRVNCTDIPSISRSINSKRMWSICEDPVLLSEATTLRSLRNLSQLSSACDDRVKTRVFLPRSHTWLIHDQVLCASKIHLLRWVRLAEGVAWLSSTFTYLSIFSSSTFSVWMLTSTNSPPLILYPHTHETSTMMILRHGSNQKRTRLFSLVEFTSDLKSQWWRKPSSSQPFAYVT